MKALEGCRRPFVLIPLTAAHVAGGSRGHSSHSCSKWETHERGRRIQRQLLHVSSPTPPWEGCTETSGKGLSSSQTLQTGEESQDFFYIQTRAVSDPHRPPVALGQGRLVGAGQTPGAAGAGRGTAGGSPGPSPGPTLPALLKPLMPFISAFLSPVCLLELLFKRRLCSPRGVCKEVQGFITRLSAPACLGREKKEGKTSS